MRRPLVSQTTNDPVKLSTKTFDISTQGHPEIIDITARLKEAIEKSGIHDGVATLFVTGSTAALTTIEYEPGLLRDLADLWERLAPVHEIYHHNARWRDGNGYAHLLSALLKTSLSVPIVGSESRLGDWQQVVLLEFDNRPRRRTVTVQILGMAKA